MKFHTFAEYLERLEGVSSRLEMTAILADVFQRLEAEETPQACYLLQGQLLPSYQSLEFQIAVKTVIKAIARLLPVQQVVEDTLFADPDFSKQEEKILKEYKQKGDLGLVVMEVELAEAVPTSQLTILQVYDKLFALAQDSGPQSQQRKLDTLVELLKNLDPISAKFVTRIIMGRLRLGFSDMTMIDALSWAMTGTKDERDWLDDAYQKKADIGKLALSYLKEKDAAKRQESLEKYSVEVGVPVIPALCQRLNSASEMIEKMHDVIAEPKYDGLRVQIHVQKKVGKVEAFVRTFTRNLEETSHMFPELQKVVDALQCESCILDAEAIGYDPTTGDLLPFQQTVQRKRKHEIAEKSQEVPIRFYVFDVLSLNEKELIHQTLLERKAILEKIFTDNEVLYHSRGLRTQDAEELHEYHEKNLAEGLEGVVVKQVDAEYQSGRKGWSWVKIKETEGSSGKLSDTIDVVVMGYYVGRGKRAGFGIGAILVGVLDEETQTIKTIAKIGTGLTDEVLRETKKRCDTLMVKTQPPTYLVPKSLSPDIWCQPGFVVEVAADELTNSPMHTAGVALRFPRLVKFREDKTWQQATTLVELKQISVGADAPTP
jgi:DNA ligase 1